MSNMDNVEEQDTAKVDIEGSVEVIGDDGVITSDEYDQQMSDGENVPKPKKKLKKKHIIMISISSVLVAILIGTAIWLAIFFLVDGKKSAVETTEISGYERVENIVGTVTINENAVLENKILISELLPEANLADVSISNSDVASVDGEYIKIAKIGAFDIKVDGSIVKYRVVDGYNVNTANEIAIAASDKKAIVIQSDIDMTNVSELPAAKTNPGMVKSNSITLYASVYGNAYTVDGSLRTGTSAWTILFNVRGQDVVIDNLHMIGTTPVGTEEKPIIHDDFTVGGTLVKFNSTHDPAYPISGEFVSGEVKNCILEKAHKVIWIHGSDVNLQGNVIREASDAGVSIQTTMLRASNIVMEDNVIINPQVAGVLFWKMVSVTDASKFANLEVKGIFEVYNWKNEETAALMPGVEDFSIVVNKVIRTAVKGNDFDDLLHIDESHKWVHIGVVVISSSTEANEPKIKGLDAYRKTEFPIPTELNTVVGMILKTKELYGYSDADIMSPTSFTNIDSDLFNRLWHRS